MDYPKTITLVLYQFPSSSIAGKGSSLEELATICANSSFELEEKIQPYHAQPNLYLTCSCGEHLICKGIFSIWECETKINHYFATHRRSI